MPYFTEEYIQFFKDLTDNNERDWFHENKKHYEKFVKKPFEQFVLEMIERVQMEDPDVDITPKDAMFRIHRDIRFSPDKTPYKLHRSAAIAVGGRKNMLTPGLYFQIGTSLQIYGGLYKLDKESLYKVRSYIQDNLDEFHEAIQDKKFKKLYGELLGEKNKVIPKEFKELHASEPLIANKAFYYGSRYEDEAIILREDLAEYLMEHYQACQLIRDFLKDALV